jgi:hypothetical protein
MFYKVNKKIVNSTNDKYIINFFTLHDISYEQHLICFLKVGILRLMLKIGMLKKEKSGEKQNKRKICK